MSNSSPITQQHVAPGMQERVREMRRAMTPAEQKLWQHLRANRLEGHHFRRQQVLGPFIADFYCHQAKLVVEVDGSVHNLQENYDHFRDEQMQEMGLHVIRFSNIQVDRDIEQVLVMILDTCRSLIGENL